MDNLNAMPSVGKGFIYILSNPAMPEIYKVGLTRNTMKQRIQELNTTGVPQTFRLAKKYEVPESSLSSIEKLAHRKLKTNNFGKEFFKGSLNLIESSVEDAIYEITKIASIELVGQAARRMEARESQIRAEKEDRALKLVKESEKRQRIQKQLEIEKKIVDELRRKYVIDLKAKEDASGSFVDKLAIGFGFLLVTAVCIGILTTGPLGWIAVAVILWWLKHENDQRELQRAKSFIEEAVKKYSYKSFKDVEDAMNAELKIGATFDSVKELENIKSPGIWAPFRNFPPQTHAIPANETEITQAFEVSSITKLNDQNLDIHSDLTDMSLSQNANNLNVLAKPELKQPSYRVFKKLSDYIDYRVEAEIGLLYGRDNTLWGGCWIAGKHTDSRNYLYRKIRASQIANHLKSLFITLTLQSLDDAVNSMDNMSIAEVENAISASQPKSAAL